MSKRIYQYPEVTELQEGDVMLIDKEGNETAKSILASKVAPALMSKTITERGVYKASDDGVRGYNEVNVDIPYTDVHVATGAIATFEGEDLPLKSLTASIVPVQSGSGDPSPTNVRPISGWTGCEVNVSGVNQWDEQWELGGINNQTGELYPAVDRIRSKNYMPCKPNQTIYLKASSTISTWAYYDINKNFIIAGANVSPNRTITTPNNAYYIKFGVDSSYGTIYNNDISVNYPSTDTEYHAYSGTTTTIPFTDGQGQSLTVYGGSIECVGGALMVTDEKIVIDGTNVKISGVWGVTSNGYAVYKSMPVPRPKSVDVMCDKFKYSTQGWTDMPLYSYVGGSGVNTNWTFILPATVTSQEEANAWFAQNPTTIVFKKTTPTTFYTQPTAIKPLEGVNNVSASTGDVDVEYQTVWVRPTE